MIPHADEGATGAARGPSSREGAAARSLAGGGRRRRGALRLGRRRVLLGGLLRGGLLLAGLLLVRLRDPAVHAVVPLGLRRLHLPRSGGGRGGGRERGGREREDGEGGGELRCDLRHGASPFARRDEDRGAAIQALTPRRSPPAPSGKFARAARGR